MNRSIPQLPIDGSRHFVAYEIGSSALVLIVNAFRRTGSSDSLLYSVRADRQEEPKTLQEG